MQQTKRNIPFSVDHHGFFSFTDWYDDGSGVMKSNANTSHKHPQTTRTKPNGINQFEWKQIIPTNCQQIQSKNVQINNADLNQVKW